MKTISVKFKAVLAVAFAVILCACLSIIATKETKAAEIIDQGTCGDNLTWVLDDEGRDGLQPVANGIIWTL